VAYPFFQLATPAMMLLANHPQVNFGHLMLTSTT